MFCVSLHILCKVLQSSVWLTCDSQLLPNCRAQKSGVVTYNGRTFSEFLPQTASVYIEQEDQHLAELTVRETMDFSALCQGAGHKKGAGAGRRELLALHEEGIQVTLGGCKGTWGEDRICKFPSSRHVA